MHVHEKFRTAVVLARGQRVDVATARTEHYERPAALPVVEHASIQRDLHRRDFTINAMAVDVSAEGFGRLVDPFGGAEDLAAGRLRVLHNLSFIEDPTRIFRAVRYENRYGFAMVAQTRELARACVEMGLVGEVSGARVRDELVAILSEDRVGGAVRRLCELGLDAEVHPALDCGEPAAALIGRIDAVRARLAPDALVWQARMGAISRQDPRRRAGRAAGAAADPPPRRPRRLRGRGRRAAAGRAAGRGRRPGARGRAAGRPPRRGRGGRCRRRRRARGGGRRALPRAAASDASRSGRQRRCATSWGSTSRR